MEGAGLRRNDAVAARRRAQNRQNESRVQRDCECKARKRATKQKHCQHAIRPILDLTHGCYTCSITC